MPASAYFNNREIMKALADMLGPPPGGIQDQKIKIEERDPYDDGWRPSLNPKQNEAFLSRSLYLLMHGPRASGKTISALHRIVEYLYRNDNCLGYVVVKEVGMATQGGAWDKLRLQVLPEWKDGNRLEYTESRLDPQTKNPYIWIRNRYRGWSMVMLVSLPVPTQVEDKIKGREPQIIVVDEAQTLDTSTYFTSLLQQLGRRPSSDDPAQIIFCCNPEGPSHWLYQTFFIDPVNTETGEWDARYGNFQIPFSENVHNLPPGYYENYVLPAVKNDPIMKARLVDGEWVDMPEGDSLFEGTFVPGVHVKGDPIRGVGILPVIPVPVIVSYDPGAAHTVVYFTQVVATIDKIYKLVFDEIDHVGNYTPYTKLVPEIIARQLYWEDKMKFKFPWIHVSDDSAFNQYRAASGSFDAWDIQKISQQWVDQQKAKIDSNLPDHEKRKAEANLDRFVIKMKAAPKGEHSIEARVRLLNEDLVTSSFMISAVTCPKGVEMFMRLTHEPDDRLKPKKKARYGHNLSAMTYGFHWAQHRPGGSSIEVGKIEPEYWVVKA